MGKKSSSKLGDTRLNTGYQALIASIAIRYTVKLRQLAKNRSEEKQFSRFIHNDRITPKRIIDHSCSNSSTDLKGKNVLVISDSSTISFPFHANRKGLGYVGPKTKKTGFDVHPSILLDAETAACYGLGGISFNSTPIAKTKKQKAAKAKRRKFKWKIPFEEKDRYKWFDSPQQAIKNYPEAASYTLVGDRETDIYDLIARTIDNDWHYLYRSKTNRTLSEPTHFEKLHDAIGSWKVKYTYDLELSSTKKRTKHTASMALKFGQVSIARPYINIDKTLPEQIEIRVVEVKEDPKTVVGDEAPIHWILLTSHPIDTVDQALEIIKWYRWRWTIEQLFRTLKSQGLDIEQSDIETYEGLINLTTMALLAAVQVMQLVQARDGQTLQKIGDVFFEKEYECLKALNTKLEGKTEKLKNPHPPDSLAFGAWVIARLGSWSGYQKQKPPGPITMIRGLIRFYNIMEGYYLIC